MLHICNTHHLILERYDNKYNVKYGCPVRMEISLSLLNIVIFIVINSVIFDSQHCAAYMQHRSFKNMRGLTEIQHFTCQQYVKYAQSEGMEISIGLLNLFKFIIFNDP